MTRWLPVLLLLAGCRGTLSPLSNKLEVGQEGYLVFTATGEDGLGDLFASALAGGTPYQVTFSRVEERLPALSPSGVLLAFARGRAPGDTSAATVSVMNLLNGGERKVGGPLPDAPRALAWSPDGVTLYARTGSAIVEAPAPPAAGDWRPIAADRQAAIDSMFQVPLGEPALGIATPCDSGGVCIRLRDGSVAVISAAGTAPARWPGDTVLYREADGAWVVRPLGGGTARTLQWSRPLTGVRELTVFPGPQ